MENSNVFWLHDTIVYVSLFLLLCVTYKIILKKFKYHLKFLKDEQKYWRIQKQRKRLLWFLIIILIDATIQHFEINYPFDPYERLDLNRNSTMQELETQYKKKAGQSFSEEYPEEKIYYISVLDQAKQCIIEQTNNCELFGNSEKYYGYQMYANTKIIIIVYMLWIIKN